MQTIEDAIVNEVAEIIKSGANIFILHKYFNQISKKIKKKGIDGYRNIQYFLEYSIIKSC